MSDSGSGGVGILGVIVGAAIVAALGFFLLKGVPGSGGTKTVDVNIKPPITSTK